MKLKTAIKELKITIKYFYKRNEQTNSYRN